MARKIKLLYVVSSLGRTGPTTQLFNLIKFLDRQEFAANLLTLSPEPKDTKWFDFVGLGISVQSLNISRIKSILIGRKHLISIISSLGPNILHTQGLRADILSSHLSDPLIRIATQRNDLFKEYPLLYGRFSGSLVAYLHYKSLRKIPNVVSCSKGLNSHFHESSYGSLFVQNGVDLTLGQRILTNDEKNIHRKKLGIDKSKRIFIASGPLIRRKSLETIIDAFLFLYEDNENRLFILGEGPQLSDLKKRAGSARNIVFTGQVSDISRYLQAADGLISASLSEGLPNIILEGLAWGLPVILSDISAHREILQTNSRAGVYFPPKDPKYLAGIIKNIERTSFDQDASREIVATNFNAKLMSENYQRLYKTFIHSA